MTPQELKNSILQLAIQGKLVEQRLEEGTAEELYKQIQTEKQAFIKAGRIKKEKPLPEIAEDEKPFDIPESWMWVRLNEVATSGLGKTLNKATDKGKVCRYLCSINVYWDGIKLDTVKEAPFTDVDREKYLLQKGDLLICEGGEAGRCAIWYSDEEMYYQNALHRVRFYAGNSAEYFRAIFELYKGIGVIKKHCKGETIQHLVQAELYSILFPLPPLAEQKRIVTKIEELLPLIDRYEEAWTKLEAFNKRFPGDMQKSLLQMAIQGKLVEQRPEEGTGEELYAQIQAQKKELIKSGRIKKDKPLPEIADDEKPFSIPESWEWVYIGDLFQHNTGKALNSSDKSGNPYEYITTSNVYWNRFELDKLKTMLFTDAEIEKCTVQKGDLLVLEGGDCGRAAIWNYDFPMRIQNHIHRLRPYAEVCIKYFYHIFYLYKNAGMINGKGIAIQGLSANALHSLIVPLPPLAEQKRIVAKLEKLLPLCERLK